MAPNPRSRPPRQLTSKTSYQGTPSASNQKRLHAAVWIKHHNAPKPERQGPGVGEAARKTTPPGVPDPERTATQGNREHRGKGGERAGTQTGHHLTHQRTKTQQNQPNQLSHLTASCQIRSARRRERATSAKKVPIPIHLHRGCLTWL